MTDTQQNLLKKKSSRVEKEHDWEETSDAYFSHLDQEAMNLTPSIVKEDLTVLKGVGPHLAEILEKEGIFSPKELSQSTVAKLTQINGIGQITAQKIIETANQYVRLKKLNDFPLLEEKNNSNRIIKRRSSLPIISEQKHPQWKIKPKKNISDYKYVLSPSTDIIIDGSNVAWMGGDRKQGELAKISYLIELRELLKSKGFENITIFCDYTLKHQIDNKRKLEELKDNRIIHQIQSGVEADKFVLQYAKEKNGYIIVHSEKYRDWYEIYGKEWIKNRRITIEYVNGDFIFNPNIETDINIKHEVREEHESEPWFEDKFKYPRTTGSHSIPQKEIKNLELGVTEQDNYDKSNIDYEEMLEEDESEIILPNEDGEKLLGTLDEPRKVEDTKKSREANKYKENFITIEKLYRKVKASDFSIIEKSQKLRSVFAGIDALALKTIHIHEFLDLICIVPIIISKLEGTLMVSADSIDYKPINDNERSFLTKKIPQSYIKALQKAEVTIINDLASSGELLEYIMQYLHIEIYPEKTITHKTLFLRSGPLQYEVLIEPLIVSKNNVGFTEKLVPFAYQRHSNIHVVDISKLSDFLHYIDQKYFLIETYSEKKSAIELNSEVAKRFMIEIRIASTPFIVYGFVLLLIVLFQGFSLLKLVINLGYGIISLYTIIIGYIYIKYNKHKGHIKQLFATPYYQRDLGLDETSLVLINERFPPKLMEQFGYEILGKNPDSPILKKIEKDNARLYHMDKVMKKKVEQVKLFEEDMSEPDAHELKVKNDLIDKYSSFLED
ncbi:MAG: helix-hairpin-helix domain-containing protein [Candidatus Hermodarchaeota archaeon]